MKKDEGRRHREVHSEKPPLGTSKRHKAEGIRIN
jgi:hypothetical protein